MNHAALDSLSAPVRQLLADARAAGAYEQLVVRTQQTQWAEAIRVLEGLTFQTLFDAPVKRPDEARCALAGLWLYLDELDRAHRIVQEIPTPSGSFWHAIVHRREGDFSNSKYWYARCGAHPVFDMEEALEGPHVVADGTAVRRTPSIVGADLVDLVEDVVDAPASDPRRALAIQLQQREWNLLFFYCHLAALGLAG